MSRRCSIDPKKARSLDELDINPMIDNYQLIGDSQLLRFSEKILKCTRKKENGYAYIGLCVSGQTTNDLLNRVINRVYPLSSKAILMIGTNDLLKGTNSVSLRQNFHKLVVHLCTVGKVKKLVLLTIPPVPRLTKSPLHWKTLKEFNECIREHHNGKDVIVIDAYIMFIKDDFCHCSVWNLIKSTSPRRNSRSSLVQIYGKNDDLYQCSNPSSPLAELIYHPPKPTPEPKPEYDYRNLKDLFWHSSWCTSPPQNSSSSLVSAKNDNLGVKSISQPQNSHPSKNLRIQVGDNSCSTSGRIIFVIESSDEDDSDDQDSLNLSINTTPTGKRSSHLVGFNIPSSKRQSLGSESNSTILDDHNDDFYQADDPKHIDQAEEIISQYFEDYFDIECKRPDQIHLNADGLSVIKNLLQKALSL